MSKPDTTMDELTGLGPLEEFGVLPRETVLETSLAKPDMPGAMKIGAINTITKARMRHQFANLLSSEMPNVKAALEELRRENPKVYLDQLAMLAEFALPKLKSVEVDTGGEAGRKANEMTLDELMNLASDDTVVSVQ